MKKSTYFNAHHSPPGAFATFTLGSKGASGGFGNELAGPANQNVYIGVESEANGQFNVLPFYAEAESTLKTFGIMEPTPAESDAVRLRSFDDDTIKRTFTAATDIWTAGNLMFSVYTPIPELPDPAACINTSLVKRALLPAVVAELVIDNTQSPETRFAFFGYSGDSSAGMHHVKDAVSGLTGIGNGTRYLLCTDHPDAISGIGFGVEEILSRRNSPPLPFSLGNTGLLLFTVAPKTRMVIRFALCFFRDGIVTTGIESGYWYRKYYKSIIEVGAAALGSFDELHRRAELTDAKYAAPHLSPERSFMLAQSLRSYYGSTQMLDVSGRPLWVVNEGEYRMMNTLDLTIDHLFHELDAHPWTVGNALEWFAEKYAYTTGVQDYAQSGVAHPGGISFTHDMGVAGGFSPSGVSVYEQPRKSGCFSYMTHEQLVNWIITASTYILKASGSTWVNKHKELLKRCLESLVNRDADRDEQCKGFMQRECCLVESGHEITTYDSLDPSLGAAKANSYGTIKRWAAFLLLHKVFEKVDEEEYARISLRHADLAASAIRKNVGADGIIPAFLDGTESGDILALVEGLVYPWFAGLGEVDIKDGRYAILVNCLRRHAVALLDKGSNATADGGWKLSSSSDITWLSKLYLFRFVAFSILGIPEDERFVKADNAHSSWLLDHANGYFAWSDQFCNGKIIGSRYYPRGVTSVLWRKERDVPVRTIDNKENPS